MNDLEIHRHLSNFSIQKKEGGANSKLIKSAEEFAQMMNIDWRKDVLPKIEDVVFRTLKAV